MADLSYNTNLNENSSALSVTVATSRQQIVELENHWRKLENNSQSQIALFQNFDWNFKWCETWFFQENQSNSSRRPFVLSVWQQEKLVSVWPLQIGTTAGVKTLTWLSTPALQYGDALIDSTTDADVVFQAAWNCLTSTTDIDLIQLDNVAQTSPLFKLLSAHCESASNSKASVLEISNFTNWDEYQSSVKNSSRRPRRKRYNKLARAGDLSFTVLSGSQELAAATATAIDWKCTWLEEKNWPKNLMSEPDFCSFMQSLCQEPSGINPTAKTAHWVGGILSLDDQPVAIEIGAVLGKRYYSYLGAYDVGYSSYSVGKIELECMIGWAIEQGLDDFDFLCVPAQYKSDWTDKSIPVENYTFACSIKGKALHSLWLKRLRPALKKALHQVSPDQRKLLTALLIGKKR